MNTDVLNINIYIYINMLNMENITRDNFKHRLIKMSWLTSSRTMMNVFLFIF